jgi:phosphate transport system substrate-binding protein
VVVSQQNHWATCMTPQEINTVFRHGGVTRWSEIRPEWPDATITVYYPGADSGTFDYFNEAIIHGVDEESRHRTDGTASEDDNILARGVAADRNAIGYFGIAYFAEAGETLRAVEVDNGEGCVAATFENAYSGDYRPLSRPLFIYTRESLLVEKPQVLGFLKFYVDNLRELPADVGYVTMPEADIERQQALIEPFIHG